MILGAIILLWAIYAWFDAKEEAAWTYPFRTFDWIQFEPEKGKQSKVAHKAGAGGVFIQLLLSSGLFALSPAGTGWHWLAFAACFLASGLTYWLVFDACYALRIGQKWHYLGSTASTDKLVKNGRVKAIVCASLIVTIFVLYNLFG